MLKHLFVRNYALIDELDLALDKGFTVITGETGAGKSIILGALSLILGKRADLKALRNPDTKCVVEGTFRLHEKNHRDFFNENDVDFEEETIIRREILPSGKSRAFINDTPVNLSVLSDLAEKIIDVHSQHQNILLSDNQFQLELLDSFAKNQSQLKAYREAYQAHNKLKNKIEEISQSIGNKEIDSSYLEFLLNELTEVALRQGEQEEIEEELAVLEHAEEIQGNLNKAAALIENDVAESGVRQGLLEVFNALNQLKRFNADYASLAERVESMRIELDDLYREIEERSQNIDHDPERLEKLDNRLSKLIQLQQKHGVHSVSELIEKREELTAKVDEVLHGEERIQQLRKDLVKAEEVLQQKAGDLHKSRIAIVPKIQDRIQNILASLNMAGAEFSIDISLSDRYTSTGADHIQYTFSANKGQAKQPLSKVASGGEMSRVMLALKATMAEQNELPSIILDEIDTGVSGETAGKIGQILKAMSKGMQVIAISHLPQIASMAAHHFKVAKEISANQTFTRIIPLGEEERLQELARLLSGEKITEAALENARNMLQAS